MYKFKSTFVLALVSASVIAVGCSSTPTRIAPVAKAPDTPTTPMLTESRAIQLTDNFDSAMAVMNSMLERRDSGFQLDMVSTVSGQSDGGVELDVTFKLAGSYEQRHFFNPGAYLIDGTAGQLYVAGVAGLINDMITKYGEQFDLLVYADFTGSTDAIPMSGRSFYRGDLGETIRIDSNELIVNGAKASEDLILEAGDRLMDNVQLAALRAYSLAYQFQAAAGSDVANRFDVTRFIVTTNDTMVGKEARFAEISVRIKKRATPRAQSLS